MASLNGRLSAFMQYVTLTFPSTMTSSLPREMRNLDDEAWLDLLASSAIDRHIRGVEFPAFPPEEVQARFVGSSNATALQRGFKFYLFVKQWAGQLGAPLGPRTRFLDFGCGWGRFLRFFWKEIDEDCLFGCDVSPLIVDVCHETGVPGQITLIERQGSLPYPDATFDAVIAHSVFTHLPEEQHLHWMRELARVMRSGSVFCLTLQPRRFLDSIASTPPDCDQPWEKSLAEQKPALPGLYRTYDSGQLAFMQTTPGVDLYGDALVPLAFIEKHWSPYFGIHTYVDDADAFRQAVLVAQRR